MLPQMTIVPASHCCCHPQNGTQNNTSVCTWNSQSQLDLHQHIACACLLESCGPGISHD